MKMKKINLSIEMKILFLILFLAAGCATVRKEPQAVSVSKSAKQELAAQKDIPKAGPVSTVQKKSKAKFFDDVLTFTNLEEIDLDGDGVGEIVAVYIAKSNANSVKIVKLNASQEDGTVIFTRTFISSVVKLSVRDGMPVLSVKEVDTPSGRLIDRIYHWDGKTFVSE
jgi:hypothetical protein